MSLFDEICTLTNITNSFLLIFSFLCMDIYSVSYELGTQLNNRGVIEEIFFFELLTGLVLSLKFRLVSLDFQNYSGSLKYAK
jgi:hypothetical protein